MQTFGKSNIQNNISTSKNAQSKGPIKMTPSQLVQRQLSGNILEDFYQKPQIKKFLNLADYSNYKDTNVPIDEPLFEPIPPLIQFTDYEPLQLKEKIFKLRNKDKVVRRVKILQPDSRLFQVQPAPSNASSKKSSEAGKNYLGNKIAPGMEACFIIKFSPEAKIDYQYELVVVTEREQFIVPIYAIGKRAMIDFPDILDFGQCPVKYVTEKPIIIRNLGEKTTKWFLTLPQDFEADKKEGVLEYGKNEQIVIKFYPKEAKPYKSEAILMYDKLQAYIPILGSAQNHVVYLSKSFVQMDEAYIGLQTQQTLQIINKSAVKVDFEWRAFSTEKEEQEKKNRLKQQLEEEEAEERMLLKEIVNNEAINEDFEIENNDDSDEEDRDEKAILLKRQKKAELMLSRKYKDIRKAIEDDLLLFQDDIFSIEPIQGQIWPNSEMTITLTFQPKGAHSYTCPAFCNISCNQDRLALTLQGDGIGPKAFLNQNEINLGDPFVNEEVRPTIVIENQGEIECKFELMPNERHFGKMFKFFPESGTLKVGERKEIKVEFSSSKPGEFKETFRWRLEGSVDFLSVLFIGHIRAPQFEFDREVIDFGKVSFNFPQEEKLKLTNKSTVPFDYNLRIPGDGKMKDKEFAIDRANGTIQAGETIEITIEFTPRYTKKYEMVLTIDIEGVAQDMKCLTIKAESEVPQVEIKPSDRLDFNEIFLRHKDIQGIQLINNSKLRAKFEVQEQKKESMVLAKYEVEPQTGIIEPGNTTTIQVKLFTNKLGDITLPLGIVIVGSNNNLPHIINIVASSIGPIVDVGGNLKELDFGQVEVLQDYSQKITITNKSKIEADFRAFTKNKVSIFKPIQKHGLLKPSESMEVEVVCCADDATKFQDVLHFVIKEGLDIDIVLKAKGIGSTIFCKEDLTYIDFQTLYTHKPKTREIFVENKGRKPQKLTWQRKQEKKKQQAIDEKANTKKDNAAAGANNSSQSNEDADIFSVVPESVVLPPKHGIMFQFRAFSTKSGKHPEQFILNSVIGNERKTHQLYTTTVDGEFIKPTLKFSEKKLYFKYTWEKNVPFMPISKNLEITSTSALPTNFMLKYNPPFSINQESFQLLYGEVATVKVDFDPGQKLDRVSGEQLGKLQIIHTEHPHRETIDLVGEVCFPNIKLEQTTINFGSILNETSKKIVITMTNVSEMGLNYEWTFLEEELVAHGQQGDVNRSGSIASRDSKRSIVPGSTTNATYMIPINEVFDILPLSGYLEPGEIEQVEFVYNAFGGQKFKTTAVCHVDGGPNYEVVLVGDSSLITYKISTQGIDLGELRFCDWVARDFYIENTGKVTFEYKVLLDQVKRKGYVDCFPQSGRILGGEKQKITIKICPVMPNEFKELIQVQIGYFEPESISIQGKGFYPAILANLDRIEIPEYKAKFDDEFEKKKNEREAQLKRAQLIAKAADKSPGAQQNNAFASIKSLEQIQNDIQRELDRQLFCNLIQQELEERERAQTMILNSQDDENILAGTGAQSQPNIMMKTGMHSMNQTQTSKMHIGIESKLYEKIVLSSFICDFGNVVINSVKQKTIRIVNVGPSQIEMSLDTRNARAAGYTLPERPPKILPNSDLIIKISYTAKNKMKYGKNKCIVPIEIKNGAKYNLELVSNITIPEITLENIEDCVDFGKVLCGQRKTFFVRFINDKEIPCQWALNTRIDMVQDKKKEDLKFTITPNSGIIPSGSKQLVQITFSPTQEKLYQHKFSINIVENHKPFHIQAKGNGTQINLEFNPSTLNIGPVLPYDPFAHAVLEVTNPSSYPTELYSCDFDKLYLTEEETLASYDEFDVQEQLFVQVREPGNPLWDFIKKSVEKKKKRDEIAAKLQKHTLAITAQQEYDTKLQQAAIEAKEQNKAQPDPVEKPAILQEKAILNPDEKVELEKQLETLSQIEKPIEYPEKVDDDKLHHIIVLGHPGSGKTSVVKYIAQQHKRYVATIDEAVDWAIQNQTNGGKKAKEYLDLKQQELDKIVEEREKLKKKAGKKAPELDAKWGPINENQFKYLTEEIIEECIRDKMKTPVCNAGLIFDGIESKYAFNHLMAMKSIMRAVDQQTLQLVVFQPQVDEDGCEVWKLIEWEGMEEIVKQEEELMRQKSPGEHKGKKKKGGIQGSPKGQGTTKSVAAASTTKKDGEGTAKGPSSFSSAVRKDTVSLKKDDKTTIVSEKTKTTQQGASATQNPKLKDGSVKSQSLKRTSFNRRQSKMDAVNEEIQVDDEPALFEIFYPKDYEDGIKKEAELKKLSQIIAMMKNEYTEKIEIPPIFDPVMDEGKKEEKKPPPKKDAKGKIIVEEEPEPVLPQPIDYSDILMKGPRSVSVMPLHYNISQLYRSSLEVIPAPVYPDPNTLPVPEPIYHQILTRPQRNIARKRQEISVSAVIKNFEILTPINNPFKPEPAVNLQASQLFNNSQVQEQQPPAENAEENAEKQPQEQPKNQDDKDSGMKKSLVIKRAQKPASQSVSISKAKPANPSKKLEQSAVMNGSQEAEGELAEPQKPKYELKLEELANNQSRWIIPPNKTLLLVVRFFTKKTGNYEGKLEFENFFSSKKYTIDVKGHSDFPTISTLTKNLYWQFKKSRPPIAPDSYLSKVFIQSENVFEFGPLLIGKNPDKRTDTDIRKVNSTTFRITNNGKYDANIEFALLSTIKENDPEYKKGIFYIEPETMKISPSDIPQELRVWAIPNAAQKFRDEIVVMIKDNPTPAIFPVQCLGSKPIVEIEEGEPVKFDRLLLKQNARKEIRIKNNGQIPCRWKITGQQNLPEEFSFLNTEGILKPTQDSTIYVSFKAIKQQKFSHQIQLEVEDDEGLGIKQETKTILIEAEAFDITVELKFPENNQENMLDFGAVRVGDIKDQYFSVKNIGLYQVQFTFSMKKKQFKENFKIEPVKVELDPNQEKQILVRFCSQREIRLNTTNSTTDITMEILEGKTLELYKPVPINVRVNSVFSKYSILPLKNINFGPIQFNDTKTLTFEIKNEGLFDFNYTVFDYADEAFRAALMEEQAKEKEARLQAALGAAEQKDNKKGAPKKEVKQEKKPPAKGGKGKDVVENQLKVGQWALTPNKGTVPKDSSVTIEIEFSGNSQKLYEQKFAIDITGRDPEDQPKGILYETVGESCIPGINCENFESIFEEQIIVPSMNSNQNITSMINSNVFFYEEKTFFFGTLVPQQHPDGIFEKFKIINPNKIPCTVKFDVRKRNPTSTEPFAFEIAQKTAKIHPHEHTYVKIFFKPTIMAQYSGIFEAIVENGEQNPKTYKLIFDLRGEGAMPTIKLEKPKEWFNESTPLLKFPKVRIDKACVLPITLKNDGQVPATVKWDLITNENFRFLDQNSYTLTPKTYKTFNIEFKPKEAGMKQWQIAMQTLLNPYEVTKFMIQGEGFYEDIVFESLPDEAEDEVSLGDCITGQERKIGFYIKNNKNETIKFNWNTQGCEDFSFCPRIGHLAGHTSKYIQMTFKGSKPTTHKNFGCILETRQIKQSNIDASHPYIDWDDSMKNVKYVTKTEYDWLIKKKAEEEQKRREEEAAAADPKKKAAAKKDPKKKAEEPKVEQPPPSQPGERADIPYDEPVLEPENTIVDKTEKNVTLKVSAISDYAKYEVDTREVFFKPTLMYTSRTHNFKVKNTSLISIKYSCKIISYQDNMPIIDPGFFYIQPKSGSIAPNCDEQFTVRFSPTEVEETNERFLVITIENMEKGIQPLVIELEGEAERPVCHFELQPSKYREKKKPELDSSYNVIDFESLGTKVKNTKKFYVVNPTAVGYEFEWKKIEEDKLPAGANIQNDSFFKCTTVKGVVLSGKKYEMCFEYTPDVVGTHESYWQFEIPSQKIVQNFLVAGSVMEPNIFFDVGKVNFGPLLLGGKNKEIVHLKNLEDVPMTFNFERESVKGDVEYADSLQVNPVSGIIKSQSEIAIEIVFIPKVETSFNYNLLCNVKRKSRPVSLNVKGIGYILHHSVNMQQAPTTPLDPQVSHLLELGDIYVNERRSKIIEIVNSGEFNFDFAVKKSQQHLSFVQIVPENGTVKQNEKFSIEVRFAPLSETKLTSKQSFTVNITSGPTYTFQLKGSAKKPGVELSFLNYDFGPQYVLKQPLPITAFLEMRNRDTSAMSIETTYEKTNYLDVNLPPGQVILPLQIETTKDKKGLFQTKENNVLKIPIVFIPRESRKYEETITFDINGLHKIDVKVSGEGIPFKLELERTEDQNIDFGIVKVNNESTKTVTLLNLSKKPVTITFDTDEQLNELAKNYISVIPSNSFQILPKERKEIELNFSPKSRLHAFKKELLYKIVDNQEKRKLLNLVGTCHGVELKLMEDTIGFGVVVIHSKKTKSLQLSNLGDIGAKFEWDFQYCKKYFTISPERGFLPPHEDSFFTITFHPDVVDDDIRFNKVKCEIEGSSPLYINLLGKCIAQPLESIQEIKFTTMVRTTTKQKVTIKNPTAEPWRIKVSVTSSSAISSNYFYGKEMLEIAPNQSADYEVFYNPLTMTAGPDQPNIKQANHEGTLFFPLPDGNALLYNLYGTSTPPAPAQSFDIATKAKRAYTQIIPINNWLKATQRFQVTWSIEPNDSSLFISGANTFDVAGESTKDYKLSIYSLKQSASKITITFKNPITFEFVHFKINLTVQAPEQQEKIEMSAIIRETVAKFITVVNPLSVPVDIKKEMLVSANDNISFNPNSFTIPANSEFGFEIVYRPLLVKEETSVVTLNSPELGQFVYPLVLKGVAQSTIQRNMTLKASLGSDITQTFKFVNYCKKQTTYTCRVDKLGKQNQPPPDPKAKLPPVQVDFSVEQATIAAPPAESYDGSELSLNVKFEPSLLGESVAILIIQSPDGGEYNCMLHGVSSPPQPKGPYKIGGAKSAPIDFKNPFFEPCEFTVRLDNPCFTTSLKNPVKIDAKKVLGINVQYKAIPGQSSNGRLIIQTDKFDYPPWVFYLQGE